MDSQGSMDSDGWSSIISHCLDIKELMKRSNVTSHTVLHWAVENDEVELCRYLISQGCNVNHADSFGTTSLMLALYHGRTGIVKLLIESGADIKLTNDYGADAVSMACANDNIDILKLMTFDFEENNDIETDSSWPQHPAVLSAACGARSCLQFIYEHHHHTINLTNKISGMNALMLAEAGDYNEIKEDLLSWGAERNERVKPYIAKIPVSATLLTPFINMPPLSASPTTPCSRCTPINSSSAFLFPALAESQTSQLYDVSTACLSPSLSNVCHPLTPNLCFSPKKHLNTPVQKKNKPFSWFKKLKRKRSRSVENLTKVKRRKSGIDNDNILDYILSSANLSEYKSCFTKEEVTFRTFLTLNEDELIEVGIKKAKVRNKLLKLIQHYKRIFFSQM